MENASVQRGLFLTFRGFPSSVRAVGPATFPVGEGCLRRGRRTEVLRIYAPVPPGRLRPSSGPGYARSTFPVGEGCLPAGEEDGGSAYIRTGSAR